MTTNFERIKNMSIDEMAEFFTEYTKWYSNKLLNDVGLINTSEIPIPEFTIKRIKQEMKQWLEAKSEE